MRCFLRCGGVRTRSTASGDQQLSDEQWVRIAPPLRSDECRKGRPFEDSRKVVEAMIFHPRTGIPWRDLTREQ